MNSRLGDHLPSDGVLVQILGLSGRRHGDFESLRVDRLKRAVGFDGSGGCDTKGGTQTEE
jgi:hypothetical protein